MMTSKLGDEVVRRTVYNVKSLISRIEHNACMISRWKFYVKFALVKLFLEVKAVSLTFSVLKSQLTINNKFSLLPLAWMILF